MRYLIFVLLPLLTHTAFGQDIIETRTAILSDGDYSLAGTVHLELFENDSLVLRFESDYLTQSNVFDVHVYLTNDNNYTAPIDTSGLLLVENIGTISGLNYSSGPMSFTLPSGVGINDYQHIVFICVQFGQLHWGDGEFEESVIITSTSDLETSEEIRVTTYPNPSKDGFVEILFQEPEENILIEVLNIEGKILSSERIFNNPRYLIELKNSGVYFIRITLDNESTVKKVIRL